MKSNLEMHHKIVFVEDCFTNYKKKVNDLLIQYKKIIIAQR